MLALGACIGHRFRNLLQNFGFRLRDALAIQSDFENRTLFAARIDTQSVDFAIGSFAHFLRASFLLKDAHNEILNRLRQLGVVIQRLNLFVPSHLLESKMNKKSFIAQTFIGRY